MSESNQEQLEEFGKELKGYVGYINTLLYRTGLSQYYEADDVIQEVSIRLLPRVNEISIESEARKAHIKGQIGFVFLQLRDRKPQTAFQCGYCFYFNAARFCDNPNNFAVLEERLHVTFSSSPSKFKQLGKRGCREYKRVQSVDEEDWNKILAPEPSPEDKTTEWRGFAKIEEWMEIVKKLSSKEIKTLLDWQNKYLQSNYLLDWRRDHSDELLAVFKRMDALSPKHRRFVYIIRFDGAGIETERIAKILNINRTNISTMMHGESCKEKVENGKSIDYKKPGAYDIFRALFPNENKSLLANLEAKNPIAYRIIIKRDFSATNKAPTFDAIANENKLNKETTLSHYIEGWAAMGYPPRPKRKKSDGQGNDGGGVSSQDGEDNALQLADESEEIIERSANVMETEQVSEMIHPNSNLLLSYLEHDLKKEIRSRVHRHLLICGRCVEEMGYLRNVFFAEETLLERLKSFATAQATRIGEAVKPLAELFVIHPPQLARKGVQGKIGRGYGLRIPQLAATRTQQAAEYKYLTIIDEDEEGELYLFLLDRERTIFNHSLEKEFCIGVPVLPENEPHKWHIFLTDKPIALPEGVALDYYKTNTEAGKADRESVLEKFFAALETGEVAYQAYVQDISKRTLESLPTLQWKTTAFSQTR
jgi:DNA-directed RNA polymerase specialized sigma24 family protein